MRRLLHVACVMSPHTHATQISIGEHLLGYNTPRTQLMQHAYGQVLDVGCGETDMDAGEGARNGRVWIKHVCQIMEHTRDGMPM